MSVDAVPVPGVVQTFASSIWRVEESRLELTATGTATLYRRSTFVATPSTAPEENIFEWTGPYAIQGDRIWLGRPSTECNDVAQCDFAEDGTIASEMISLVPSSWGDRVFRYERRN